jgi:hypothetical protein
MANARPVLRVGDRVSFDGDEHLVVGIAGPSVRLRGDAGGAQVVLAGHLMAAPKFTVLDGIEMPQVEPTGLLASLPEAVVTAAHRWREHLAEVETGLPPGARARVDYDPRTTTLAER